MIDYNEIKAALDSNEEQRQYLAEQQGCKGCVYPCKRKAPCYRFTDTVTYIKKEIEKKTKK